MIKFTETKDGYIFNRNDQLLAVGVYESDNFHLLHEDKVVSFANAMQAFVHLRSVYDPSVPSIKTMEVFTTPARAIDNLSQFKDNSVLKGMPKEVFYAHIPS